MAGNRAPVRPGVNSGITEDERLYSGGVGGMRPESGDAGLTSPGDLTTQDPTRRIIGEVISEAGVAYISSSRQYQFFWGGVAVPQTIDDAEELFGIGLYQRMADEEATLGAVVKALKTRVLSNGLTINPSHPEPKNTASQEEKDDYENADKARSYIKAVIARLAVKDRPIVETLRSALDCSYMGHKLAEMTADLIESGEFKGKMGLKQFGTKPRENYAFVVNTGTNEFLGVIAKVPGGSIALRTGLVFDPKYISNMIAPEKLINFTLDDRDGDPRGKSWFRPLYTSWWGKQTTRVQCEKALSHFAGGMVTITIPTTKSSELFQNPVTGKRDTLMNSTLAAASELANGRIAVFSDGTNVAVHMPQGELRAFEATFERQDREMVTCFLLSSRALLEAQHGSKADSGASQDLVDELVDYCRGRFCELLTTRMLRWLVTGSYGEEFAEKYCPIASMQNSSEPDFPAVATAVAAMQTAQWPFTNEQRDYINTEKLGLPSGVETEVDDPAMGGGAGLDPASFPASAGGGGEARNANGDGAVRPGAGTEEAGGGGEGTEVQAGDGTGGGGEAAEGVQKTAGGKGSQGEAGGGAEAQAAGASKDRSAAQKARFADSVGLRQVDAGRAARASRYQPKVGIGRTDNRPVGGKV